MVVVVVCVRASWSCLVLFTARKEENSKKRPKDEKAKKDQKNEKANIKNKIK